MSKDNIAEIRERAEKATKAPWTVFDLTENGDGYDLHSICSLGGEHDKDCPKTPHCHDCITIGGYTPGNEPLSLRKEDADFIAHARQDIPNLCDALDYAIEKSGWVPTEKDFSKIDQIIEKGKDGQV